MLISILVTSYNYDKYIKNAIESIKNQTFEDWELIIVDDASEDRSVEIITKATDSYGRVRTIVNDQNMGLEATLEKAFKYASGKWIAILESDDEWTPDYLEEKIKVILKNPDAAVIFNDVETIGNVGKMAGLLYANRKFLRSKKYPRNMFWDMNLKNRIVTFSSVMISSCKLY